MRLSIGIDIGIGMTLQTSIIDMLYKIASVTQG